MTTQDADAKLEGMIKDLTEDQSLGANNPHDEQHLTLLLSIQKLREGIKRGLECAEHCKLNATFYIRTMNEALTESNELIERL